MVEEEFYLAFGGEGVRLEIFSRPGMGADTGDHADYRIAFTGQAFELNFQCASRPKGMSVSRGCPRTVPHRSHTRSRPTGATTAASLPTPRAASIRCSPSSEPRAETQRTQIPVVGRSTGGGMTQSDSAL